MAKKRKRRMNREVKQKILIINRQSLTIIYNPVHPLILIILIQTTSPLFLVPCSLYLTPCSLRRK
ncbi:MAG: hypothetical protein LBL13_12390 [Bacteroidales bacterium]|nr:hypothetical protein [Bacteroidales bacterium]